MSLRSKPKPAPPEYGNILQILAKKKFEPGLAVERQVATHVRSLIQEGKLAANTRLPPIRTLAEIWDTNYFSVQAALRRIVGEGLLVQSPKLGTFVAPMKRSFRRACLYHDHDLSFDAQDEFVSRLNIWLYRLLAERGIQVTSYFDHRKRPEMHTFPPEVRDMVRDRKIDALIATSIDYKNLGWLAKLGIPHASPFLDPKHGGTFLDYALLARQAAAEAVKAGRKRLGLIHRGPDRHANALHQLTDLRAEVERATTEFGIELVVPEDLDEAHKLPVLEQAGFHLCEELLEGKSRPDALFVYPDTYTRGVTSALLKNGIRVPEDIVLISHRNAETAFFAPFPVVWLVVEIEDFARGLLKQIDAQVLGKKASPVSVLPKVETAPPRGRKSAPKSKRKS